MSAAGGASRIGVFGGTFDPPHVGHLLLASDAAERLSLDLVLWVPARAQPLKADAPSLASPDQRRKMVELTVGEESRFALEPMELDRTGLSFTVDTLTELRRRYTRGELYLLVGEDSWQSFASWRDPARIRELATPVVLTRGERIRPAGHPAEAGAGEPLVLETRRIDVSATEIRERVREGKSIRGFVVAGVERYIASEGLYR